MELLAEVFVVGALLLAVGAIITGVAALLTFVGFWVWVAVLGAIAIYQVVAGIKTILCRCAKWWRGE
jgi:hypothetical protein